MLRRTMLPWFILCLLSFLAVAPSRAQSQEFLYDAGVSIFTIDMSTGSLTSLPGSPFTTGYGPGAQIVDHTGKFVYSPAGSSIAAYAIDGATGNLALVPGAPFGAPWSPQFLTIDGTGRFLFAYNADPNLAGSSYPGGPNFLVYAINRSTGALTLLQNTSPLPFSVSWIAADPTGSFLYAPGCTNVPDGNTPCNAVILGLSIGTDGSLTPLPGSPFSAGNSIPASIAVDPSGRFVYVATTKLPVAFWGSTSLEAFKIDPATGALTNTSTAQIGDPQPGASAGAQVIATDPAANFVYVATRGSIEGFSIDQATGMLSPVPGSPFGVTNPPQFYRGASVEPTGSFVYISQTTCSDCTAGFTGTTSVTGYRIDGNSGTLTLVPGSPFFGGSFRGFPVSRTGSILTTAGTQ